MPRTGPAAFLSMFLALEHAREFRNTRRTAASPRASFKSRNQGLSAGAGADGEFSVAFAAFLPGFARHGSV